MGPREKRALIEIAREAIRSGLSGRPFRPGAPDLPELLEKKGAFVTLHKQGALRGCIGTLEADRPLYEAVAVSARQAAFHDPRFAPLVPEEMALIDLEISVLGAPVPVAVLEEIRVGEHGLIVERGRRRGVLLPQVATEMMWDRETFLGALCEKAGLSALEWRSLGRDPEFKLFLFSAEVLHEQAPFL